MENFKVIIVEDVPLELKGTEGIFKNDIPEAEIIGTAESEIAISLSAVPMISASGISFLKIPSVPFSSKGTSSTMMTLKFSIFLIFLFFIIFL